MTAPTDKAGQGRRRFLKGVMAVGGTTVLVAVGREAMVDAEPETTLPKADTAPQPDQGYHVTAHIESYYDKARF